MCAEEAHPSTLFDSVAPFQVAALAPEEALQLQRLFESYTRRCVVASRHARVSSSQPVAFANAPPPSCSEMLVEQVEEFRTGCATQLAELQAR